MSTCKIPGCDSAVMYKQRRLCQKHYFRIMRNGTAGLVRRERRILRHQNEKGYQLVWWPTHPLAHSNGYVYEHRAIIYRDMKRKHLECGACEKSLNWATCHVDHVNERITDNRRANLRILCRGCNVKRGFTPESYENRSAIGLIEYEGKRDTASGWARDPRVQVSRGAIVRRKKAGMSDYEALFAPKVTHNGYRRLTRELQRKGEVA